MTDPATVGDLPTIDQARAIAAGGANDTDVVCGRYTGPSHRSAGASLAKTPGVTNTWLGDVDAS